jgi:hypothetical protein
METPPQGDKPFADWLRNLGQSLVIAPTSYGSTAAAAAAIVALSDELDAKLAICDNPATRTKAATTNKTVVKKAAMAKAREVLAQIRAYPALTPGQRDQIQIPQKDTVRSPKPVPAFKPGVQVFNDGSVRVFDPLFPERRGIPANVDGTLLLVKIDGAPPVSIDEARFAKLLTKARGQLALPPGSNGKLLHVLAAFYNERGDLGPVSDPVSVTIAA